MATEEKKPVLEIKNLVTKFYTADGIVNAVDNVSYTVHEGEIVGVVGESGSGKSVTALSVMRLIPWPPGKIENGSATLNGEDMITMDDEDVLKVRGADIAMIFQEPMTCLLYTSPSPRDRTRSRMPASA